MAGKEKKKIIIRNHKKKTNLLGIVIFILALVLGIFFLFYSLFRQQGKESQVLSSIAIIPTTTPVPAPPSYSYQGIDGTWCYDSDNYPTYPVYKYYVKGYCQDRAGIHTDFCTLNKKVVEYHCQFKKATKTTYKEVSCSTGGIICKYGCTDGACLMTYPTITPIQPRISVIPTGTIPVSTATPMPMATIAPTLTPLPTSTPTSTPTLTPTPTPISTLRGIDGTWCYDSDIGGPNLGSGSEYCSDSSGTYYDSCSKKTTVQYYTCTGTRSGNVYKNVRCAAEKRSCWLYLKLACVNGACQ